MIAPYSLEFKISDLPKTPNQLLGAHWRVRSGHAKKWHTLVFMAVCHNLPPSPLKLARIHFTRVSSGNMDDDGLTGSFKCVRDALVKCGVIEDDTPKVLPERPVCMQEKCAPKHGHIKIRVEQITNEKEST